MEVRTGSIEERLERLEINSCRQERSLKNVRGELGDNFVISVAVTGALIAATATNIACLLTLVLR